MCRFFILLFLALIIASPIFSQKKELKTKFGKLSDKEINLKSYEADPAAPAVVLFDKGNVSHRYDDKNGFTITFERHTRIKVFNQDETHLADIFVPHYSEVRVGDIKASSFNLENGKMVETKMDKSSIFEEEVTKDFGLTKFVIPNVKEGSIIDYTYTTSSRHYIPSGWTFQRERIPTIWSEFEASIPSFIDFKKMSQGWIPFSLAEEGLTADKMSITLKDRSEGRIASITFDNVSIDYEVNKMHFIQENIPALKTEEYVNSPNDYLSRIDFDIRTIFDTDFVPSGTGYRMVNSLPTNFNRTWAGVGKSLLEDVYDRDLDTKRLNDELAVSLTTGKASHTNKVAAIYEYIGKNYLLKDDYDRMFKSQTLETLVKDRKGTPTDLNLLFINMLRRAGLEAWPLLVSTTDNGRVRSFRVSLEEFNRVIAAVQMEDSTLILIDASAFPNPIGLLDKEDLGQEGLLLRSKDNIEWIPIQNKLSVKTAVIANLNLTESGAMGGSVVCFESGYQGVERRQTVKEKGDAMAAKERFKEWVSDGEITDLKVMNGANWNENSLKMEFNLNSNVFTNVSGDKIYCSPMIGLGFHENPFKNPDRKFNVDLGPIQEENYNLTIKIPAGFKVDEVPKPAKITLGENDLSFEYITETKGDLLKINVRYKQKTDFISSTDYADLQQFFGAMASKMEEQVIVSKL